MALPSSSDPELPSALGRYQIVRLLGQGAMGRVLLAYDPVLDREVAVKHLRDDLKIPPDVREGLVVRMRHEARAAARVMHPHLVTLHDMGEDASLGLFLVFEYVEGPTLKQRLLKGALDPLEGARLARELGAALTVAHKAGIVHRDVKPENIILSKSGGKIADFGIARIPDSTLTHAGGLMGTPAYSAPETFQAGAFSPESDQFSLAASMYEALSGKRAFPGDDAIAVASKIAMEPPGRFAEAAGLSPTVDDAFARALAKKPGDRFSSCEAFGVALERCVLRTTSIPQVEIEEPAPLPARTGAPETRPPGGEKKTGQVLLGAAVVVATAALVLRAASQGPASNPEETAGAPNGSAQAQASAQASSSTPHSKPRGIPIPSSRSSKPKVDAEAAPSADPLPADGMDAGVDAAIPASDASLNDAGTNTTSGGSGAGGPGPDGGKPAPPPVDAGGAGSP